MSKKLIFTLVCVVLVIAGGAIGFKLKNGQDHALAVETAPVGRLEIVQTVNATGRIQPQTQVEISADVSAKILQLAVEDGDWVEQGQFLLELDRERYVAALESAEANLRSSQAEAELAKENQIKAEKDYGRIQELFDQSLEPESSRDAAYAQSQVESARYRSALDQVERARASVKQARDDLSKTRIFAPMSGTVSQLNKEVGEIALGSQFQKDVILVISNMKGMEAQVDVDENDIVLVSLGDTAHVEVDALPGVVLEGEVTEIANTAKLSAQGTADQKADFEVKISITDPDSRLRPGMTATADIVTDVRENALGVPIQCVAVRTPEQLKRVPAEGAEAAPAEEPGYTPDRDGYVEIVWVVRDGTAEAVQVETGIQSETHIEIVDGLAEGDAAVVGPYRAISQDLKPGLAVTATEKTPPAGKPSAEVG